MGVQILRILQQAEGPQCICKCICIRICVDVYVYVYIYMSIKCILFTFILHIYIYIHECIEYIWVMWLFIYISTQLHSLSFNQQYKYVYLYMRILYITYRPCNTSTNSRNLERYILHTYCIAHTKLKLSEVYRGSELRTNLAHGFRVKTKWTIIPTNGRSKWFLILSTAVCSMVYPTYSKSLVNGDLSCILRDTSEVLLAGTIFCQDLDDFGMVPISRKVQCLGWVTAPRDENFSVPFLESTAGRRPLGPPGVHFCSHLFFNLKFKCL